jgi:hypothetical protein
MDQDLVCQTTTGTEKNRYYTLSFVSGIVLYVFLLSLPRLATYFSVTVEEIYHQINPFTFTKLQNLFLDILIVAIGYLSMPLIQNRPFYVLHNSIYFLSFGIEILLYIMVHSKKIKNRARVFFDKLYWIFTVYFVLFIIVHNYFNYHFPFYPFWGQS